MFRSPAATSQGSHSIQSESDLRAFLDDQECYQ